MKDLISEFEFHALWQGKIMPFGSNTFLFVGGRGGGRSFKTF